MSMKDKLSPKHRRFVVEYLKDQNASQAAIRAGYSKKNCDVVGPRLLGYVGIRSAIEKMLDKHEITAERVIKELGRLAFSDLRSLYKEDGSLKPVNEWPEDTARCVSGIESEEIFDWDSGQKKNVGDLRKVKLWSKPQTLEILARHFKLLTDKVEHSGSLTVEQLLGVSRE